MSDGLSGREENTFGFLMHVCAGPGIPPPRRCSTREQPLVVVASKELTKQFPAVAGGEHTRRVSVHWGRRTGEDRGRVSELI